MIILSRLDDCVWLLFKMDEIKSHLKWKMWENNNKYYFLQSSGRPQCPLEMGDDNDTLELHTTIEPVLNSWAVRDVFRISLCLWPCMDMRSDVRV